MPFRFCKGCRVRNTSHLLLSQLAVEFQGGTRQQLREGREQVGDQQQHVAWLSLLKVCSSYLKGQAQLLQTI